MFALPSPFLIAVRYWHADHSSAAYPTVQHFLEHLAGILAREAQALVEAGIDIVQLDDVDASLDEGLRLAGQDLGQMFQKVLHGRISSGTMVRVPVANRDEEGTWQGKHRRAGRRPSGNKSGLVKTVDSWASCRVNAVRAPTLAAAILVRRRPN